MKQCIGQFGHVFFCFFWQGPGKTTSQKPETLSFSCANLGHLKSFLPRLEVAKAAAKPRRMPAGLSTHWREHGRVQSYFNILHLS